MIQMHGFRHFRGLTFNEAYSNCIRVRMLAAYSAAITGIALALYFR
jgi:hypothetical protein